MFFGFIYLAANHLLTQTVKSKHEQVLQPANQHSKVGLKTRSVLCKNLNFYKYLIS